MHCFHVKPCLTKQATALFVRNSLKILAGKSLAGTWDFFKAFFLVVTLDRARLPELVCIHNCNQFSRSLGYHVNPKIRGKEVNTLLSNSANPPPLFVGHSWKSDPELAPWTCTRKEELQSCLKLMGMSTELCLNCNILVFEMLLLSIWFFEDLTRLTKNNG